jgi:uncharacterized membrane protein YkoI
MKYFLVHGKSIAAVTVLVCALSPALARAADTPPKNRISMEAARKAAVKVYGGQIKGEELEFENKMWIYSFDLKKAGDKNVHEVQIDAITGKLVSDKTETPAQETREAKEEN